MKYFITKGEFKQTLIDYNKLSEEVKILKEKLSNVKYLRFNKIKSPLDYDVIGYKNGEPIRSIKGGHFATESEINASHHALDKKIEAYEEDIKQRVAILKRANNQIKIIESPLKEILIDKYIKGKTYKYIMNKYTKIFVGVSYEMQVMRYIDNELDNYFEKIK